VQSHDSTSAASPGMGGAPQSVRTQSVMATHETPTTGASTYTCPHAVNTAHAEQHSHQQPPVSLFRQHSAAAVQTVVQ
jgi:hypothetical protein